MKLTIGGVLAAAWALWRRNGNLLVRVAGPFLFLPVFALQLLLPMPSAPAKASLMNALRQQGMFVSDHLGAFTVGLVLTQFGALALLVLAADQRRQTVAGVLARAGRLLPRFLLATVLVQIPARLGLILLVLPGLLVMARTMLFGPLLVADGLGAAASVGRSVRLTAGHAAALTGIAALVWGGQVLMGEPLLSLDAWLRAQGPNPVAVAMADAVFAGVSTAAALASVLLAVSAHRLLTEASSGT